MIVLDHIEAEAFSPLGRDPLIVLDLDAADALAKAIALASRTRAIVIGVDRSGRHGSIDPGPFDCLLTTADQPPDKWVSVASDRIDQQLSSIARRVADAPHAAAVFAEVLRDGETLSFEAALRLESLAFSALLGGGEFRQWLAKRQNTAPVAASGTPYLTCSRDDDVVQVTLDRPEARNAICAGMRDALWEALAAILDDPSAPALRLRGAGACFSTGGELAEFGSATDLAGAHSIRVARSNALLLDQLGDRAEVHLHGACIGSGIEIAAAAARRFAVPGMFAQLPELNMGLMPGAGGTVSIPRRIGRHRACYMVLSAARVRAETLATWGLVELVP